MKTSKKDFPGVDRQTSGRLASDVQTDEAAMIGAISDLRRQSSVSLEAIGFLLELDPAQISRYLGGLCSPSLASYIRIARALGYRCKISIEKADTSAANFDPLEQLKLAPHQVHNRR